MNIQLNVCTEYKLKTFKTPSECIDKNEHSQERLKFVNKQSYYILNDVPKAHLRWLYIWLTRLRKKDDQAIIVMPVQITDPTL